MRSPLTTALLNPFNLVMPVLAVLAGLLVAWWLFPLGLLLWVIMVATIANDKALRINYNMEARLGTLPSRFQDPYSKAVRAQMRIFNSLLNVGGENRRALEPLQGAVETLVEEKNRDKNRQTSQQQLQAPADMAQPPANNGNAGSSASSPARTSVPTHGAIFDASSVRARGSTCLCPSMCWFSVPHEGHSASAARDRWRG